MKKPSLMESIKTHAGLLLGLLAAMWLLETLDQFLPMLNLDRFGIRPRHSSGLVGIPLSPFLHADFGHLMANSIPFVVLGGLVMFGGVRVFIPLSLWIVAVGGLGVWLLGSAQSIHLGASLLIFGYLGFLLSRGLFERHPGWVVVSLAILIFYGGMIHGVLPGKPGISWLGHLCGFLAGVSGAWLMFPKDRELYANG